MYKYIGIVLIVAVLEFYACQNAEHRQKILFPPILREILDKLGKYQINKKKTIVKTLQNLIK